MPVPLMPSTGSVDELGACRVAPDGPAWSVMPPGTPSTDSTQVPFIVIISRFVVCGFRATAEAIKWPAVPSSAQLTVQEIGFAVTSPAFGTGVWQVSPLGSLASARLAAALEITSAITKVRLAGASQRQRIIGFAITFSSLSVGRAVYHPAPTPRRTADFLLSKKYCKLIFI